MLFLCVVFIIFYSTLLTFLVALSILVLKLSFSQRLSLSSCLSLPRLMSPGYGHSLFGSHWWRYSIGKCARLSQPSGLVVRPII